MTGVSTQIQQVAVYPDRARVARHGQVSLDTGLHRLEVFGLPVTLQPDSLRVAARGTAHARLLGAQVQRAFFEETPAERIRELEQQLEASGDEKRGLEARVELIDAQRIHLAALAGQSETYATALAAGEMSVEAQLALFDGLRRKAEALGAERLEIDRQRRELERRIQKLQNELNRFRGAPRREQYTALVDVEILQAGDLSVELTYVVSGAGWRSLYDLRLSEGTGGKAEVEASYLAEITQRTGEDWQEVDLTLSTARPALAGILPEVKPWFIGPPQRPKLARAALQMEAKPAQMMAARQVTDVVEAAGAAPEEIEAETVVAAVEATPTAVVYRVPGTVTIPADGGPHKVTAARFRLEPDLDYVSAPRVVEAVYRRARLRNNSAYTLLPGVANLFSGDEFIGSTRMELAPPQGEIELFFGTDDRLRVERELKRREVDKRFIGGRRRLFYGYEIRLENLLPVPARLVIHDSIPAARHEEIKVRLESAQPNPTEQSELNLLKWELTLAPGEKRTLRYDFSVEHPQAMEVVGLP